MDLTRRPAGKWVVDFGWRMSAGDAALYEEPFRWVKERVYPMRQQNRREAYREYWWRHVEPRQGMWGALDGLSRYIATPTVAKHRLFAWCDVRPAPGIETAFGGTHPPPMLEHGRYPWIPPEIGRPDGRNHMGEGSGVSRGRGRSTSKLAGDQGAER